MKVVLVSLMLISLMFTSISDAKIDPKTVIGIWLFDEIKGDVAKDSSQNRVDGKILGNSKLDEGKFGKALELNGSTNYVDCGNDALLNLTDAITVVGWMTTTGIARWNVIAAKEIWDSKAGWVLYIGTNTRPAFSVSSTIIEGPTAIATNEWYHLAGVADSKGNVTLYVNGEQDNSGNSKLTSADIDLRIGARHTNPGGAAIVDAFPGSIDEVAIFNAALTNDDIKSIMTDGLENTTGIAAVSHAGKLAKTWGAIKAQFSMRGRTR